MKTMKRVRRIVRKTKETQIDLTLNLDGTGKYNGQHDHSRFLNHMLEAFAKHGHFDLVVKAKGDTHIDDHHLTEDLGIALGEAIAQALGDKKGIIRYGNFFLPMDDTLSYVALDLCNRPYFVWKVKWGQTRKLENFDGQAARTFL